MARGARIVALGSAVCLALGACSAGEGVDLAGAIWDSIEAKVAAQRTRA